MPQYDAMCSDLAPHSIAATTNVCRAWKKLRGWMPSYRRTGRKLDVPHESPLAGSPLRAARSSRRARCARAPYPRAEAVRRARRARSALGPVFAPVGSPATRPPQTCAIPVANRAALRLRAAPFAQPCNGWPASWLPTLHGRRGCAQPRNLRGSGTYLAPARAGWGKTHWSQGESNPCSRRERPVS